MEPAEETIPDAPAGFDPNVPYTLKLEKPLRHGSAEITELVFQPMNAGHMRRIRTPLDRTFAMVIELMGYLTGQPQLVIDQLPEPSATPVPSTVVPSVS